MSDDPAHIATTYVGQVKTKGQHHISSELLLTGADTSMEHQSDLAISATILCFSLIIYKDTQISSKIVHYHTVLKENLNSVFKKTKKKNVQII